MSEPLNRRYRRRFDDPSARFLSNGPALARFDEPTRERITDLLVTLDGWDLVEEATRATRAEADRLARWESTTQVIRRGDPGE